MTAVPSTSTDHTPTRDLHVVLGASGGAGKAIIRALVDAGIPTRGVNRPGVADVPAAAEIVAADITEPADLDRALEGAAVAYMAAQPPYHRWAEEFPSMLEAVIDGCARHDVKLVMVDNLYAYGPGHDHITEATQRTATDAKGRVRAAMQDRLMAAHADGEVRVAIGQASDYFGAGSENSGITALAIEPTAGTGSLRWMGSLDAPHSVAYLPDIARAYVILGTRREADGSMWILPHGDPVTGRAFLATVNATLDEPRKVNVVSKTMLRVAAPFHRISRESLGIVYQWTDPWIADDTAFQAAFGPFPTTPLDAAVATAVRSSESGRPENAAA
jgi:nucleoside-diphosphate-sugar epimerase